MLALHNDILQINTIVKVYILLIFFLFQLYYTNNLHIETIDIYTNNCTLAKYKTNQIQTIKEYKVNQQTTHQYSELGHLQLHWEFN